MTASAPTPSESDVAPPRLGDRGVRWLVALTVVLQLLAWSELEGYQLADSVEYMDRAHAVATGADLQAQRAHRSFAFSLVFLPLFAAADALGLDDLRPLAWVGRVMQMGFGIALVLATVRLGARLAGRRGGLVAGALVALNPIFQSYSVAPVAGVAAAWFLTRGVERALWPSGRRGASWITGLWLGAAVLCSYKSLAVVALLVLWIVLRERWRGRAVWTGLGGGVLVACALQAVLDRLVYGRWGGSLVGWLMDNVCSRIVDWSFVIYENTSGVVSEKARLVALWFYERQNAFLGYSFDSSHIARAQRRGDGWYLEHLTEFLVWPALALVVLGLVRALRRPRSRAAGLALIVFVFVGVASTKGDKSFRLWLPILPLLASIGALGFDVVRGPERAAPARRGLAWLLVVAALPLGRGAFLAANPRVHGSYWRAVERVNELADARPQPLRLGSAYHWAVYLRTAPTVELAKSSHPLLSWSDPAPEPGGEDEAAVERRAAIRAHLESLDALIVHLPLLSARPGLLALVNSLFGVDALYYEPEENAGLGPVYLLTRLEQGARGRRFFRVRTDAEAAALRSAAERPVDFRAVSDREPADRLTFLDFDLERLPGDGLHWLTYHWTTDARLGDDWIVADRVTAPDGHHSFQNNHAPAYGVLPTSTWRPGDVVSESYAFVPAGEPFATPGGYRPLGGAYRRGDLLPISLWMGAHLEDESGAIVRRMVGGPGRGRGLLARAVAELSDLEDAGLARAEARLRLAERLELEPDESAALRTLAVDPVRTWIRFGVQSSEDGLFEVGRWFLPVDPRARVPDDGRALGS